MFQKHYNKQRSNNTQKTKDRPKRTPLKTGGELKCSGRVNSSCSTSETRHVYLVKKPANMKKEKSSLTSNHWTQKIHLQEHVYETGPITVTWTPHWTVSVIRWNKKIWYPNILCSKSTIIHMYILRSCSIHFARSVYYYTFLLFKYASTFEIQLPRGEGIEERQKTQWPKQKGKQTNNDLIIHRKQKIDQNEPH
jgi:hypothetical protein